MQLEYFIHNVTKQAVHGWSHHHWHNYTVSGLPRRSRRGYGLFVPVHLRYAVSRDKTVYAIKQASTRDTSEEVTHPFALSNLVGMTCRRHAIGAASLRHLIFYNVTNPDAWAAMVSAFHAGVSDSCRRIRGKVWPRTNYGHSQERRRGRVIRQVMITTLGRKEESLRGVECSRRRLLLPKQSMATHGEPSIATTPLQRLHIAFLTTKLTTRQPPLPSLPTLLLQYPKKVQ